MDTIVVVAVPADPAPLVVDGGLPAEEMHVTLGFYGETSAVPAETVDALRAWVDSQAPGEFTARVGGVARLGDDDPQAVVLLVEAVELAELRGSIEAVAAPDRKHPHFTPHITLGYGVDMPDDVPSEVSIGRVELWVGDEHYAAPTMTRRMVELDDWLADARRRQTEMAAR